MSSIRFSKRADGLLIGFTDNPNIKVGNVYVMNYPDNGVDWGNLRNLGHSNMPQDQNVWPNGCSVDMLVMQYLADFLYTRAELVAAGKLSELGD